MNSSIFSSDYFSKYLRLSARVKVWHVFLLFTFFCIALSGKWFIAKVAPTTQWQGYKSLSQKTEILIVGSSRVQRGVDPTMFTGKMVNLSSGGLSYTVIKPIILNAVKRAPNIKIVLIEFDIFLLRCDGMQIHGDDGILYELGLNVWDLPIRTGTKWAKVFSESPCYYVNRLTPEVLFHPFSLYPTIPQKNYKGFAPHDFYRDLKTDPDAKYHGAETFIKWHKAWLESDENSAHNLQALLHLTEELLTRNITVVLITLPHLKEWKRNIPLQWEQECESALCLLRNNVKSNAFIYWDFSCTELSQKEFFHDGLHLNKQGVEKFREMLNKRIIFLLDDSQH